MADIATDGANAPVQQAQSKRRTWLVCSRFTDWARGALTDRLRLHSKACRCAGDLTKQFVRIRHRVCSGLRFVAVMGWTLSSCRRFARTMARRGAYRSTIAARWNLPLPVSISVGRVPDTLVRAVASSLRFAESVQLHQPDDTVPPLRAGLRGYAGSRRPSGFRRTTLVHETT